MQSLRADSLYAGRPASEVDSYSPFAARKVAHRMRDHLSDTFRREEVFRDASFRRSERGPSLEPRPPLARNREDETTSSTHNSRRDNRCGEMGNVARVAMDNVVCKIMACCCTQKVGFATHERTRRKYPKFESRAAQGIMTPKLAGKWWAEK